jgi:hypothetical protein
MARPRGLRSIFVQVETVGLGWEILCNELAQEMRRWPEPGLPLPSFTNLWGVDLGGIFCLKFKHSRLQQCLFGAICVEVSYEASHRRHSYWEARQGHGRYRGKLLRVSYWRLVTNWRHLLRSIYWG